MLVCAQENERFLEKHCADEAWDHLDNDPTLMHEEKLSCQRASIANRLLAVEHKAQNKDAMMRAARRAGACYVCFTRVCVTACVYICVCVCEYLCADMHTRTRIYTHTHKKHSYTHIHSYKQKHPY